MAQAVLLQAGLCAGLFTSGLYLMGPVLGVALTPWERLVGVHPTWQVWKRK